MSEYKSTVVPLISVSEPAKDEYANIAIPSIADIIYETVRSRLERLILLAQFIILAIDILPWRKLAGAEQASFGAVAFLNI